MGPALHHIFCRAGPACPAGGCGDYRAAGWGQPALRICQLKVVRNGAGGVEPRPYAYLRDFTTGGQGRPPLRITRSAVNRGVGEIGEALPVAEKASRFRGSAPIGGHNSGWESGGTTVGNRRPLRTVTWGTVQRATARVAPTDVLQGARWGGTMWASSPTDGYMGCGTAGDREGRPYGCVTRGALGREAVRGGPDYSQ